MAGNDAQKQLLTLIRDFASEKSQGERRVVGLRKQIEELRLALDVANAELEDMKLRRETAEQELKGYEVELAVNESAIQTLEARISTTQKEISTVRSDLQDLKSKDRESRDEFINKMFELNAKIRSFQKTACKDVGKEDKIENSSEDSCLSMKKEDDWGTAHRTLEDKLVHLITELTKEKEMFQVEQDIQKQVQQELLDLEMKVLLMEAIAKATRDLQDLTRYPSLKADHALSSRQLSRTHTDNQGHAVTLFCKCRELPFTKSSLSLHGDEASNRTMLGNTVEIKEDILSFFRSNRRTVEIEPFYLDGNKQSSQLEQKYSCLAVELQRRSVCPSCCQDNIEALEGSLQINEAD